MLPAIKYWSISVLAFFLLAGCKKSSTDSPSNYMRFKLNGTAVDCDSKFGATPKITSGPDANITFYANWGDNAVNFQLFTHAASDIAPGQYVFGPNKAYAAQIWPAGILTTPGAHPSYIAGNTVATPASVGSGQITITEINAQYIKGAFDFVTDINSGTGLSMTITGGEFLVKR